MKGTKSGLEIASSKSHGVLEAEWREGEPNWSVLLGPMGEAPYAHKGTSSVAAQGRGPPLSPSHSPLGLSLVSASCRAGQPGSLSQPQGAAAPQGRP